MSPRTLYPIASTTKAINATLLGMLIDEGQLAWDEPVQRYFPSFRLGDANVSSQVTLRDLVTMRTGLPRHDWTWLGNPMPRADLISRLRYLELSSGFRERYQYNNLTVTAAGQIAEGVSGQRWEDLVRARILEPLGMTATSEVAPAHAEASRSYHETAERQLVETPSIETAVTAPSGGALWSTVEDMARWLAFNLNDGCVHGRPLIRRPTLREINTPQILVGPDSGGPTESAAYALGWFVDSYRGHPRVPWRISP